MTTQTTEILALSCEWEQIYRNYLTSKSPNDALLRWDESQESDFLVILHQQNFSVASRILDIGTGTGDLAFYVAQRGYEVVGLDVSVSAIKIAQKLDIGGHYNLRFVHDNFLFTQIKGQFDIFLDRGCLSLLADDFLDLYLDSLSRLSAWASWYFVKVECENIHQLIAKIEQQSPFKLRAMYPTHYTTLSGKKVKAFFVVMRKYLGLKSHDSIFGWQS